MNQHRWQRVLLWNVTSLWLILSSGFAAESENERHRWVDIDGGVNDWVVQESTGRVFASLKSESDVVEFSAVDGELRRFPIGNVATELLIKRNTLVAACPTQSALHVIDLKTSKSVGTVKLTGKGPYALFCSDVDNDFVYCICNTGTAWWDGEVFQIDVKSLTVRKQIKVQGWGQSHVLHVAMSRDGKWIVPDARGASSPSGADLMKVNEDELTFTQIRDHHSSFGQMVAGPMNRYWTFGNQLYPLDIQKSVRAFVGTPVAIHPQVDLAVSKTDKGLALQRFTDAGHVATVEITAQTQNNERQSSRNSSRQSPVRFDPTLQFDLPGNRVFLGTATRGSWIGLKSYAGLSPLHVVRAPSEATTLVGRTLRIPLEVTNADGPVKTKLEIVDGPDAAKIDGAELVWKPTAQDVGFTTVQVRLKPVDGDGTLDSVQIPVHVTLPTIDLGFHAKTMELSPSGNFLLVWGLAPGQESRHPAHAGPDNVAVIDLREMKIVARKVMPQGVRCATIDDRFVYIAPNSGNLFYRQDHTLSESKRLFLQATPARIIKLSSNRLAVIAGQLQVFDSDRMEAVTSADPGYIDPRERAAVIDLGDNVLRVGERMIDRETGKTIRIVGSGNLPLLVPRQQQNGYRLGGDNTVVRWGRMLKGSTLANYKGSQIAAWPGQRRGIISSEWPVSVLVGTASHTEGITTTLELANLIDGTVQHSAVIDISPPQRQRSVSFYGERRTLLLTEGAALCLKDTELLIAPIPESVVGSFPVPAHFKQQQPTEVEAGGDVTIPLAVGGKTEGVTFALLAEDAGIELDGKTAELKIDTDRLWQAFVDRLAQSTPLLTTGDPAKPEFQASPEFLAENGKRYKALMRKELPDNRLAAILPVSVVLQDKEGQVDGLNCHIAVTGPRAPFTVAIQRRATQQARQQAELAKARAEALAKRQAMQAAKVAEAERNVAGNAKIEKRLDELESRMRRIEAVLDAILRRLDEDKPEPAERQ